MKYLLIMFISFGMATLTNAKDSINFIVSGTEESESTILWQEQFSGSYHVCIDKDSISEEIEIRAYSITTKQYELKSKLIKGGCIFLPEVSKIFIYTNDDKTAKGEITRY